MRLIEKAVTGRCKTRDRVVGLRNSPVTELHVLTQLKTQVYKQNTSSEVPQGAKEKPSFCDMDRG